MLGGGNIIKTVSDAVDDHTYNKEERAADELKAQENAAELEIKREQADKEYLTIVLNNELENNKLAVANSESAREREVKITESEHASWLQKNVAPIIALVVILFTFTLWTLVLFRHYEPKSSESLILGALSTLVGTILNYYFGSSMSSLKKDEAFNKISKRV